MEFDEAFYRGASAAAEAFLAEPSEGAELEARIDARRVGQDGLARLLRACAREHKPLGEGEVLDLFARDPADGEAVRLTVHGAEGVRRLAESGRFPPPPGVSAMQKATLSTLVNPEYGFRLVVSRETARDPPRDPPPRVQAYRFKRRWSFALDGAGAYRLDVSATRTARGSGAGFPDLLGSGLAEREEAVELEVEVDGSRLPPGTGAGAVARGLLQYASYAAQLAQDVYVPLRREDTEAVLLAYLRLVGPHLKSGGAGRGGAEALLRAAAGAPRQYFAGPQPVSIQMQNVARGGGTNASIFNPGAYVVTDKADGERCLLFVGPGPRGRGRAAYALNNRLEVRYVGAVHAAGAPGDTLLDGELVGGRRFLAFDAYFRGGAPLLGLPLEERLGVVAEVTAALAEQASGGDHEPNPPPPLLTFERKRFVDVGSVGDLLQGGGGAARGYEIDGVVYTPTAPLVTRGGGSALFGTWDAVLKWKPARDNTVDFLVAEVGAVVREGVAGMQFELYVGQSRFPDVDVMEFLRRQAARGTGAPPPPAARREYVARRFGEMFVAVDPATRVPACENGDPIRDYASVECRYEVGEGRWVPTRVRHDKTALYARTRQIGGAANDYKTARSIFHTILYPITEGALTEGVATRDIVYDADDYYVDAVRSGHSAIREMSAFHNRSVKGLFLYRSFPGRHLLDLACGRGGDLRKWREARFPVVIGVDRAATNITGGSVMADGIYSRYGEMAPGIGFPHRWAFFAHDSARPFSEGRRDGDKGGEGGAQDHDALRALLWGRAPAPYPELRPFHGLAEGIDLVSCQFAMHYFFRDEATLRAVLGNVASALGPGGVFLGTCLDGERVMRALGTEERLVGRAPGAAPGAPEVTAWSIERQYEPDPGGDGDGHGAMVGYGKEIGVFIDTINRPMTEYLVDFALLEREARRHGLRTLTAEEIARHLTIPTRTSMPFFDEIYAGVKAAASGGTDAGAVEVPTDGPAEEEEEEEEAVIERGAEEEPPVESAAVQEPRVEEQPWDERREARRTARHIPLAPHEKEYSFMNRAFIFIKAE